MGSTRVSLTLHVYNLVQSSFKSTYEVLRSLILEYENARIQRFETLISQIQQCLPFHSGRDGPYDLSTT